MGRTAANSTTNPSWAPWRRLLGHDHGATTTRPGRQSLQSRILSRALLISVVPLLVISSVTLGSLLGLSNSAANNLEESRQELGRDVAGRAARANAVGVAREMEQLVAERVDDLIGLAATPDVRRAARAAALEGGDALATQPTGVLEAQFDEERRLQPGSSIERYVRATTRRQPMLAELFISERNGLNVASSARPNDLVQRDETWWKRAWSDGLFLGSVVSAESSDTIGQAVAVRIDSSSGERLGMLRAIIDISQLQQIASRTASDTGTEVSLLTSGGELLAETRTDHDAERIADADVELDDDAVETVETALDRDEPGFALQGAMVTGYAPMSVADGRLATLLEPYDDVDTEPLRWVVVVDQPNDAAFAPLQGLAGVQQNLSSTARTFVVIIVVTLIAALAGAFLVATRLAERIVGPLRSLGAVARDIAERQLPTLVRQAQRAEGEAELPSVPAVQLRTNDEIEDVADAFNVVSNTAAELAAEQAKSRRNVARMFVSLGRRNQNLLSRQLEFIDRLERDTADPDLLEDLFRLDHLATRMRRNAESLLVLAGEDAPRRWAEPVSLADVVRGAVGEIEDYQRINIDGVDEASLVGSAVSDVTHLIAELIENATQFSPPDSEVAVVGRRVVEGYALAVVDDGVGMSSEQLDDANRRLEMSPLVDRVPSSYLGLFVVGRLAARHGIRVRLVESTTEGVTAKVLLPTALVEPLPRSVPGRELSDVEARPALAPGAATGVAAHGGFARHGRSSGESSTAVIDVPIAARGGDATGDDETQPLAATLRRRERTIGRSANRRDVEIDLRDSEDAVDGDPPRSPASDRDEALGGDEPMSPASHQGDRQHGAGDDDGPSVDESGSVATPLAEGETAADGDGSVGETDDGDGSVGETDDGDGSIGETDDGDGSIGETDDRDGSVGETDDHDVEVSGTGHLDRDEADDVAATTGDAVGATPPDAEPPRRDADDQDDQQGDTADREAATAAALRAAEVDPQRPVVEVRRRASKRGGANGLHTSGAEEVRAVLRTERTDSRSPAPSGASAQEAQQEAQSERVGATTTAQELVDEDGVALTASEREARAARDRLARFQRAVQQGRAEATSRHNGGERHDA